MWILKIGIKCLTESVKVDILDKRFLGDEDLVYTTGLKVIKYGAGNRVTKQMSETTAEVLVSSMLEYQKEQN